MANYSHRNGENFYQNLGSSVKNSVASVWKK